MARGKGLRREGRDRDEEGVAQGKGVGGREHLRKDTTGGAREGDCRARGGCRGGREACGGDEHGQALQEWREKQRGEKREQGRGWIGGSEVEDERWGQGWNCAAVGGEMGACGRAQGWRDCAMQVGLSSAWGSGKLPVEEGVAAVAQIQAAGGGISPALLLSIHPRPQPRRTRAASARRRKHAARQRVQAPKCGKVGRAAVLVGVLVQHNTAQRHLRGEAGQVRSQRGG